MLRLFAVSVRPAQALSVALALAVTCSAFAQEQRPGGRRGGQGARPAQVQEPRPPKNEELFDVASKYLAEGLYQVDYSAKSDALYATSAVGRQVSVTELLKVDPKTLEVVARAVPPAVAEGEQGGVHAVYGVGVDEANGYVWVTNTRTGGVAAYQQSDLSLVKQFPSGTVGHGRDVVIHPETGKAYFSSTQSQISVIDGKTLEVLPAIEIKSNVPEGQFMPMSLHLDVETGKLYTVSMRSAEAVIIDTATDTVDKVFAIEGAERASGVAYDSANKRLVVANQGSSNLLIVDPADGKVVHTVDVGPGALNVAFEPVSKLSFVSGRGSGSIAVVNAANGELVAVLDGGTLPNHLQEDGKGNVFAVNKSRGEDDAKGNHIKRITLKAK